MKELHLYSNKLTALPESIVALTALKTLDLRRNPLSGGPLGPPPQSPAVEAWLAALKDGGCKVYRY